MFYETLLIDRSYYQILRTYNAFQTRFGLMGLEMGLSKPKVKIQTVSRDPTL